MNTTVRSCQSSMMGEVGGEEWRSSAVQLELPCSWSLGDAGRRVPAMPLHLCYLLDPPPRRWRRHWPAARRGQQIRVSNRLPDQCQHASSAVTSTNRHGIMCALFINSRPNLESLVNEVYRVSIAQTRHIGCTTPIPRRVL